MLEDDAMEGQLIDATKAKSKEKPTVFIGSMEVTNQSLTKVSKVH